MPEQEKDRMDEILVKLTRIETRLSIIETKMDNFKPQLDDHEVRIRELEGKSGKKYDALSLAIISALLVGVVGYVIGKIF